MNDNRVVVTGTIAFPKRHRIEYKYAFLDSDDYLIFDKYLVKSQAKNRSIETENFSGNIIIYCQDIFTYFDYILIFSYHK